MLPDWLAVTVHVPLPLFIVIVALPDDPLPLHTPEPAIDTGKPEVAVAATLKLLLYAALAGGAVVQLIVCDAVVAFTVSVTVGAAE